jgi:hypothetical protein
MSDDLKISRELAQKFCDGLTLMGWNPEYAKELRALLAAPAVERQAEPIYQMRYLGDGGGGWVDLDKDEFYRDKNHKNYQTRTVFTSPPAPVAVAQHPFADKVVSKLQRFMECTDDGQGADIGRHWFDLLTQLGLLNRVQRSPALWEITQQGEDCLDKVKEMNQCS